MQKHKRIVIAGLDPAIHADSPPRHRGVLVDADVRAKMLHGSPGQARDDEMWA
jgi:hypothetical protein